MARLHFGSNREQAKPKKVVGRLRKTQLITTFGNGSIVDMPDYSVIMAGSNYWKDSSPILHEPNLEKLLKVSHFKEPYVSNSQDDEMTPDVPAFRFPYYHFCPDHNCGRLMPYWGFGDVTDRSCATWKIFLMSGGSITEISANVLQTNAMVPFASVSQMKPVDWTVLSSNAPPVEKAAQWLAVWLKTHSAVTPAMENVLGWVVKRNIMIRYPVQHSCGHFSVELPMCIFP